MDPCWDGDTPAEPQRDIYVRFNVFGGNIASHSFAWTTGALAAWRPNHPSSSAAAALHSRWIQPFYSFCKEAKSACTIPTPPAAPAGPTALPPRGRARRSPPAHGAGPGGAARPAEVIPGRASREEAEISDGGDPGRRRRSPAEAVP